MPCTELVITVVKNLRIMDLVRTPCTGLLITHLSPTTCSGPKRPTVPPGNRFCFSLSICRGAALSRATSEVTPSVSHTFSHGEALGTPDEDDWPEVRELPDYPKVSFAKRV